MVAPDWLACFAAGERAALFDAYFESAPCAALLQTLVTCGALALSLPPGAPHQAQLQGSFQAQMQLSWREVEGTLLRNSQQKYNKRLTLLPEAHMICLETRSGHTGPAPSA